MKTTEGVLVVLLAGLATVIAMGKLELPHELTSSSIVQALLLVVSLVLFSYSPVVGLASIALFAVILFNRNIRKTAFYSNSFGQYGDENIYKEHVTTMPYSGGRGSQPRDYSQFRETHSAGWGALDTFEEGFQGAPYGSSAGYVDGQFPLDEGRPSSAPFTEEYDYRPDTNAGDNEFQRYGPNLDEKLDALQY